MDFHDRTKNPDKDKVLTKEDKQIIKEQEITGKIMDEMKCKEHYLRKEKDKFDDDPSLLLYRLPLNVKQMDEIYNNIIFYRQQK
jgi:ssDNA-binding Zn-finger/Zn-ribbon topoisomerase 1